MWVAQEGVGGAGSAGRGDEMTGNGRLSAREAGEEQSAGGRANMGGVKGGRGGMCAESMEEQEACNVRDTSPQARREREEASRGSDVTEARAAATDATALEAP